MSINMNADGTLDGWDDDRHPRHSLPEELERAYILPRLPTEASVGRVVVAGGDLPCHVLAY